MNRAAGKAVWGYHYILNLGACNPYRIQSAKNIESFTETLAQQIGSRPQSLVIGHFCKETNSAYLDVFSHRPYDTMVVDSLVHLYFQPEHVSATYLERSVPSLPNARRLE